MISMRRRKLGWVVRENNNHKDSQSSLGKSSLVVFQIDIFIVVQLGINHLVVLGKLCDCVYYEIATSDNILPHLS